MRPWQLPWLWLMGRRWVPEGWLQSLVLGLWQGWVRVAQLPQMEV